MNQPCLTDQTRPSGTSLKYLDNAVFAERYWAAAREPVHAHVIPVGSEARTLFRSLPFPQPSGLPSIAHVAFPFGDLSREITVPRLFFRIE